MFFFLIFFIYKITYEQYVTFKNLSKFMLI